MRTTTTTTTTTNTNPNAIDPAVMARKWGVDVAMVRHLMIEAEHNGRTGDPLAY